MSYYRPNNKKKSNKLFIFFYLASLLKKMAGNEINTHKQNEGYKFQDWINGNKKGKIFTLSWKTGMLYMHFGFKIESTLTLYKMPEKCDR